MHEVGMLNENEALYTCTLMSAPLRKYDVCPEVAFIHNLLICYSPIPLFHQSAKKAFHIIGSQETLATFQLHCVY